jgi:acyl-[acyl-carrier-protein]-phospholipid O-acyltransferase/long-chain-fatty-acid--[acyl-carrier-protein] ligase
MGSIACKVTDLDSGEELGPDQPGMLWITGPNVMLGYYGHEDQTREAIQDGWYKTGDVAVIDQDGFIKITGRMSRFSKIGGEMVPHLRIEELLTKMCDECEDDLEDHLPTIAVTSVADAKKGEKLIVLYTQIGMTPEDLRKGLSTAGLPNLFIPTEDSFVQVDELPLLGSGKLDLKALKLKAEAVAKK